MQSKFILYGSKGTGSVVIEAILAYAGIPYEYVEIPYERILEKDPEFLKINSLSRVPALKLPSGQILTESGAMAVYLGEISERARELIPADNAAFWRDLFIITGEIYPTFTFGDDPSEWVSGKIPAEELRKTTDKFREELWFKLESSLAFKPWALGDKLSVLDFYIGVMTQWRPRIEWFQKNCPGLHKLTLDVHKIKESQEVFLRNFSK